MRKDDIIGQKLFETCKLSEFYLNLVVNCKEQDESPLQLARAYKQKLYEIVDRYDRLLDANRQRQQLSLTFDKQLSHQQSSQQSTSRKAAYHDSMSSKTSTPNKTPTMTPTLFGSSQAQATPSAPITPSASFASTPTTPFSSQSYQRSLTRQPSFNQTGRSFIYTHNSSKYQATQQHQQNTYSTSLQRNNKHATQQTQPHYYSSLTKTSKLLQQYAFLYDDYDSADDQEDDEQEMRFSSVSSTSNVNAKANKSSSATTGLQSLSCKLNYEAYSNTFDTNLNSRLLLATTTHNNNNNNSQNEEDYDDEDEEDNEEEEEEEEEFNNDLSESQIIEKSYSNLSKDSGVFADSYHSDYSNSAIGISGNESASSQQKLSINGDKKEKKKKSNKLNKHHFDDDNSSIESINKTIDSNEDYADHVLDNNNANNPNKTILSQDENDTVIDETTEDQSKLIWGSITRLVESDDLNSSNKNTSNTMLSSSPINLSKTIKKSNTIMENFEEDENNDDDDNETAAYKATSRLCSEYVSGPSYSSSNTVSKNGVIAPVSTSSTSSTAANAAALDRTSKELKFLNTSALMNVSMLDNIQATNTHLDFDNMNTSILMFN